MPTLDDESHLFRLLKVTGSTITVDGISVDDRQSRMDEFYYSFLTHNGSINYTGSYKPQLSVDRRSIIRYHNEDEEIYKRIAFKAIQKLVCIAQQHIEKYNLASDTALVNQIWKYVFDRMQMAEVLFVNYMSGSQLGEFKWPGIASLMKQDMTISDFMKKETLEIPAYDYHRFDLLTSKMEIAKLFAADEIVVDSDNNVRIHTAGSGILPENEGYFHSMLYLVPASYNCECFKEYDLISSLYPLVPERLTNALKRYEGIKLEIKGTRAFRVTAFSNAYTALFNQDARTIHPVYGLYTIESHLGRKLETYINAFDKKRSDFQFLDFGYDRMQDKKGMMMLAYIAPRELTVKDKVEIEKFRNALPDYYQGVFEGWTVLVTAMEIDNLIVMPGKRTREEMIAKLSPKFWEEYKDFEFKFLDGSVVKK